MANFLLLILHSRAYVCDCVVWLWGAYQRVVRCVHQEYHLHTQSLLLHTTIRFRKNAEDELNRSIRDVLRLNEMKERLWQARSGIVVGERKRKTMIERAAVSMGQFEIKFEPVRVSGLIRASYGRAQFIRR